MTERCVKCGCTTLVGPRYVAAAFGLRECLRYACVRCGYAWSEPTCGAEWLATAQEELSRALGGQHD